jgi:flavin reductase (DIM6/NTAB) family NADH-FMN oxidoreductase RutF
MKTKKSLGLETYLFPLPTVVVGSYDEDFKANMMVASWTGIVSSRPAMVSVSLRKATYSYQNIIDRKAFTISIPSRKHIVEMDLVGTKSGRNLDKFTHVGLSATASNLVNAPYVEEMPLTLECELVEYKEYGLHTMFIGQVKDIKIDPDYLQDNGMPDIRKIDPIAYAHGDREYYALGHYLGKANRLWQTTLFNPKYQSSCVREIVELINRYYYSLDNNLPIDDIQTIIDWDRIKIINGLDIIDSYDSYAKWYSDVKNTMFNKKHIIEKLDIEIVDDNTIKALINIHFQANKWVPGEAESSDIEVSGSIEWVLAREDTSNKFKLIKYTIDERKI